MVKFLLRIDGTLYEELKLAAKDTNRSVSALINFIIKEYLKEKK